MQRKDNAKTKSAPKKSYNIRLAGSLTVIFIALIFAWNHAKQNPDCVIEYRQDSLIKTPSGQEIAVEIASAPAEQAEGLGSRECIDPNWGMLFSFNQEAYRYFWMKDMNFAIDIVWLDSNKKIVEVTKNVQPDTYPKTFTSIMPAQYVLELPAGRADELGFALSAQVSF